MALNCVICIKNSNYLIRHVGSFRETKFYLYMTVNHFFLKLSWIGKRQCVIKTFNFTPEYGMVKLKIR